MATKLQKIETDWPHLIREQFEVINGLDNCIYEIWDRDQQTLQAAEHSLRKVKLATGNFQAFVSLAKKEKPYDEVFEVIAHLEERLEDFARIAEGNLRVASGPLPIRQDGLPDDFIGPTGYIPF